MVNPFEGYFRNTILYLRISGCWYNERDTLKMRVFCALYATFCFVTCFLCFYPSAILAIIEMNDMDAVVVYIRNITAITTSVIKFVNFYLQRKKVLDAINLLTATEVNYEVSADFNPTLIVQKYYKLNERWKKILAFSLCGYTLHLVAMLVIGFVFQDDENYYFIENGEKVYRRSLPVEMLDPIFGRKTKQDYLRLYIFLVLSGIILALTVSGFGILYISLISCTTGHFDVLAGAFKTIHPRCQERLGIYEDYNCVLQNEMDQELIKCVKHLQVLRKVLQYLNEIFFLQIFAQTGGFLVLMGVSMFNMAQRGITLEELAVLNSTIFEFFVCCWFGNMLPEGNNALAENVYLTNWVVASKSFKNSITITMQMLKKPVHLTILGIAPVTLETFISMLKSSYSIFTLLQSMDVN